MAQIEERGRRSPGRPTRRMILTVATAAIALYALLVYQCNRGGTSSGVFDAPAPSVPDAGIRRELKPQERNGYRTWDLAVPDGRLMAPAISRSGVVWVGGVGADVLVSLLDRSSTSITYTYVGGAPGTMAAAVAQDGMVWFAQQGQHAIGRFEPERRLYEEFPTPTTRSSPSGIAVDVDGAVWFTETSASRIGRFDPATRMFVEYSIAPEVAPYWLDIAPDGRVFFTTLGSPFVGMVAPATGTVELMRVPGLADSTGTTGLDVADDGTVWFGIRGGGLGHLDPSSGAVQVYQSPGVDAYGVAVGARGWVWLASTQDVVFAFNPSLGRFCSVGTGDGARWLAAGDDGAIWVVEGIGAKNRLGRIDETVALAACA